MKERRTARKPASLAGQLLLAHPALRDPHFKRTVVLLSAHDAEGAMGVVLNRPLDKQLGELNPEFALGPLAGVPVYAGGPVKPQQLVIVSWKWLATDNAFELHFGVEPDKAAGLVRFTGCDTPRLPWLCRLEQGAARKRNETRHVGADHG